MYLSGWKETFPAGKDVPHRPVKGLVSKDTRLDTRQRLQMWIPPEKEAGYPDVPGSALSQTHAMSQSDQQIVIDSQYKINSQLVKVSYTTEGFHDLSTMYFSHTLHFSFPVFLIVLINI
jgi:hypothetical protein